VTHEIHDPVAGGIGTQPTALHQKMDALFDEVAALKASVQSLKVWVLGALLAMGPVLSGVMATGSEPASPTQGRLMDSPARAQVRSTPMRLVAYGRFRGHYMHPSA
jgi:hypothetical protein